MNPNNKKITLIVGGSIILLLIITIGAFFLYRTVVANRQVATANSYDECIKLSGSKLLESYPQQCVTEDGKTFVQPNVTITPPATNGQTVSFETVLKGTNLPLNLPKQYTALRSKAELDELISKNNVELPTGLKISEIDFTKEMYIIVLSGQKPNGGYGIEIQEITETSSTITVKVLETNPGTNCMTTQVITHPYHIVKLSQTEKTVEFDTETQVQTCR